MSEAEHDRHSLGELCGEGGRRSDVHDVDANPKPACIATHEIEPAVTQRAIRFRDEQHGAAIDGVDRTTIVVHMRPATAAVVLGLLILIIGAFLIKAQTSGFTP